MVDEKVTTRTDGVVTERIVETHDNSSSSGGGGGLIVGILILAAIALGVFYLMSMNNEEAKQTEAISGAATNVSESVEKAAGEVSDAAKDASAAVEKAVDGDDK